MSFRSIVRDLRDGIGSLSRRGFEVKLPIHERGKSKGAVHELYDEPLLLRWAGLPPELLRDVIRRLEEDESAWPGRKHVVACAAVCRAWREMCKEIVKNQEFCGKLTFPVSLKQPGHCSMFYKFYKEGQIKPNLPSVFVPKSCFACGKWKVSSVGQAKPLDFLPNLHRIHYFHGCR